MFCNSCHQKIVGKCLTDFSTRKKYHFNCQKCQKCQLSLKGHICSKNGSFYHRKCYQCSQCGQLADPALDLDSSGTIKCSSCKRYPQCVVCEGRLKTPSPRKIYGFNIHVTCLEEIRSSHHIHDCIVLDSLVWKIWSPRKHFLFSKEIQQSILAVYMLWKRPGTLFSQLPRDMIVYLCQHLAMPVNWDIFNGYSIFQICTPTRCDKNLLCRICDSLISPFLQNITCTTNTCRYYKYKCPQCNSLISKDCSEQTSCTEYRCIAETCTFCQGELVSGKDDSRELCTKSECQTYYGPCSCGNLIRRHHPDPFDAYLECSTYRCIQERCERCHNMLAPSPSLVKTGYCKYTECTTLNEEEKALWQYLYNTLGDPDEKMINAKPREMLIQYRRLYALFLLPKGENSQVLYALNRLSNL